MQSGGYHSDGGNSHGRDKPKPSFVPTKSRGFTFERRARTRSKPISQVKMEQDLEMKRREEEAENSHRFVPHEVQCTSLQCMMSPLGQLLYLLQSAAGASHKLKKF
eukprot:jgi/Ulvmu1/6169/UM028_0025.1